MRHIVINVTEAEIAAGKPGDSMRCPIAIAAQRVWPGAEVEVSTCFIWVGFVRYLLPSSATMWIYAYDAGEKVTPFEFRLPHVPILSDQR